MGASQEYYNEVYLQAQKEVDIQETGKLQSCLNSKITGKKILDVGCGPGVTLEALCENNHVTGIDIVEEYCEMARENGFKETFCYDIEKGLPFLDKQFDIVICTDVFEHIFKTEYLGTEIHRVLKDGGYAILNVPNHNVLGARILFLLGNGIRMHENVEDWNYFHIRFFTWNSWKKFLDYCGFKITKTYHHPIGIPVLRTIKHVTFPKSLVNRYPNLLSRRFLVKVEKQ